MFRFYFLGVLLVHAIFIKAQVADSLQGKQLGEVVITAHRSEQSAFATPATVYSLSAKTFNSYQPRTAPEALMGVAGVFVQKTTHGAGSPFIRGLTGNQTLLLIDGIRLNNSTFRYGPNQYFNTIDAFSIERIEVLAGGGSVQYGSDAIGGTIQVFTPDVELGSGFSGKVLGRIASAGMEYSGRVEATYSQEKWGIRGGITRRQFGDLLGGRSTGFQSPSGYNEFDFDLKAKIMLYDQQSLTIAYQNVNQRDVPLFIRYQLDNFALNVFNPQNRQLTYAKWQRQGRHTLWKEQTATISYQNTHEGRQTQRNGSDTRRYEDDRVKTWGLNLNNRSDIIGKGSVNTGIEIYRDQVKSQRFDLNTKTNTPQPRRGLYPDGATMLNYSIYSLYQHQFVRNITLSGGLRYNGFVIDIPDETLGTSRLTPRALVGNVGLSYSLSTHSRIFASASSGFRAPNVDDLGTLGIVDFRYEIPTSSLRPEKSMTTEIGYKLQTQRASATVVYYHTRLTDLITRLKTAQIINGLNVYQKENTERAYINGWEVNTMIEPLKNWQWYGNLSYCFGQNVTKNEPVRRIPPLNGRLGTSYQYHRWSVRGEYIFAQKQDRLAQGDKDDNRIAKGGTPAWKIVNLQAGYDHQRLGINLRLENLLDEEYRIHGSGINGAGRSAWLTMTGHF